jgi:hypothetical protein
MAEAVATTDPGLILSSYLGVALERQMAVLEVMGFGRGEVRLKVVAFRGSQAFGGPPNFVIGEVFWWKMEESDFGLVLKPGGEWIKDIQGKKRVRQEEDENGSGKKGGVRESTSTVVGRRSGGVGDTENEGGYADHDGVFRPCSSYKSFFTRLEATQGLYRLWDRERAEQYIVDMVLQEGRLWRDVIAINRGTESVLRIGARADNSDTQSMRQLNNLIGCRILDKENSELFRMAVLGQWQVDKGDRAGRPTLALFFPKTIDFDRLLRSDDIADRRLIANASECMEFFMVGMYGWAFLGVLDPFVKLLRHPDDAAQIASSMYLISRIELMMIRFMEIIFVEGKAKQQGFSDYRDQKSAELLRCMCIEAADLSTFTQQPHYLFMKPNGIAEQLGFKVTDTPKKDIFADKKKLAAQNNVNKDILADKKKLAAQKNENKDILEDKKKVTTQKNENKGACIRFLLHKAELSNTSCAADNCRFRHVGLGGVTQADLKGRIWAGTVARYPTLRAKILAAGGGKEL